MLPGCGVLAPHKYPNKCDTINILYAYETEKTCGSITVLSSYSETHLVKPSVK